MNFIVQISRCHNSILSTKSKAQRFERRLNSVRHRLRFSSRGAGAQALRSKRSPAAPTPPIHLSDICLGLAIRCLEVEVVDVDHTGEAVPIKLTGSELEVPAQRRLLPPLHLVLLAHSVGLWVAHPVHLDGDDGVGVDDRGLARAHVVAVEVAALKGDAIAREIVAAVTIHVDRVENLDLLAVEPQRADAVTGIFRVAVGGAGRVGGEVDDVLHGNADDLTTTDAHDLVVALGDPALLLDLVNAVVAVGEVGEAEEATIKVELVGVHYGI